MQTHNLYNGKCVALVDIPDKNAVGCKAIHLNSYGGEQVGTLVAVHKDWCVVAVVSGLIAVSALRVPCARVYILVEDSEGVVVRNQWALPSAEPAPMPEVPSEPEPEPAEAPKRRRRAKTADEDS